QRLRHLALLCGHRLRPAGRRLVHGLDAEAEGLDAGHGARRLADRRGPGPAGARAALVSRRLHRRPVRPLRPAGLDHVPRRPRRVEGGLSHGAGRSRTHRRGHPRPHAAGGHGLSGRCRGRRLHRVEDRARGHPGQSLRAPQEAGGGGLRRHRQELRQQQAADPGVDHPGRTQGLRRLSRSHGRPDRRQELMARPQVMGIVNVTPDSFSDGGRHDTVGTAVAHGLRLVEQGAAILDIGGESTRPGAEPVSVADEIARVVPVIEGLRAGWSGPISIDTMKPEVARAAVAAGATMWNDVAALGFAPDGLAVAARLGCEVVLMHMKGEPRTMQDAPRYDDVVGEVTGWLLARAEAAMAAGIARERIWPDPGIGFGKTAAHNLVLTARLDRLAAHGFPVLYGASGKRTIQSMDPPATEPSDRRGGSLALALEAARNGARIIRVHDVRETVQALAVQAAVGAAVS